MVCISSFIVYLLLADTHTEAKKQKLENPRVGGWREKICILPDIRADLSRMNKVCQIICGIHWTVPRQFGLPEKEYK